MVSVAMCTYNGERYLAKQLESISLQTQGVDELVVCDDGSTDNTISLLQEFAQNAPFKVHIHRNGTNLGSTRNFEKALSLCTGDILILCDQDDIWKPDKVRKQVAFFEQNPNQDAVFSNADLINGQGEKLGHKLWDNFGFDEKKKQLWRSGRAREILFQGYVVTGATLAIRKSALRYLTPFPTDIGPYIHDAWIALVTSLNNRIGFINECLISYRVHEKQQVGFGEKLKPVTLKERLSRKREEKLAPLVEKADLLQRLYEALKAVEGVNPESLSQLRDIQQHFQVRANLPASRLLRLMPAFRELKSGRYAFSSKDWWLPLLGDLFE